MTVISALSSFRELSEMIPHKRALVPFSTGDPAAIPGAMPTCWDRSRVNTSKSIPLNRLQRQEYTCLIEDKPHYEYGLYVAFVSHLPDLVIITGIRRRPQESSRQRLHSSDMGDHPRCVWCSVRVRRSRPRTQEMVEGAREEEKHCSGNFRDGFIACVDRCNWRGNIRGEAGNS